MKSDPLKQPEDNHELLTPEETAERLRVSAEQVRCLIRKGQLAAINVGSGKKRPLYRITEHALHDFLDRRWRPGQAICKKQFKKNPPVQDFFPGLK